jgi:hypothetical protein
MGSRASARSNSASNSEGGHGSGYCRQTGPGDGSIARPRARDRGSLHQGRRYHRHLRARQGAARVGGARHRGEAASGGSLEAGRCRKGRAGFGGRTRRPGHPGRQHRRAAAADVRQHPGPGLARRFRRPVDECRRRHSGGTAGHARPPLGPHSHRHLDRSARADRQSLSNALRAGLHGLINALSKGAPARGSPSTR